MTKLVLCGQFALHSTATWCTYSWPAAVDDSVYMLPEVELPPLLKGLPDNPTDLQPELKKLIQGVVLQAGGLCGYWVLGNRLLLDPLQHVRSDTWLLGCWALASMAAFTAAGKPGCWRVQVTLRSTPATHTSLFRTVLQLLRLGAPAQQMLAYSCLPLPGVLLLWLLHIC